jgi:hypothetical protein
MVQPSRIYVTQGTKSNNTMVNGYMTIWEDILSINIATDRYTMLFQNKPDPLWSLRFELNKIHSYNNNSNRLKVKGNHMSTKNGQHLAVSTKPAS